MSIDIVIDPPLLTDSPTDFSIKGFRAWGALPTWSMQANATAAQVNTNALTAVAAAAAAQASAASAAAAGNSNKWVSGTNYAADVGVFSPITLRPYRRKSAGGGTTDPSIDTANWGDIGAAAAPGLDGTTLTGSVTLTASSPAAMTITPATPGLYLTLPDATTCTKAAVNYSAYNAGEFDVGFKDGAGNKLGWVRPGTGAIIGLANKATVAGVWAPYGLEKLGVTARLSLSYSSVTNLASAGATLVTVTVDANRTLFIYGGAYVYAIVYDASTQLWGSPVTITTGGNQGMYAALLVGTDKVLVGYKQSTCWLAVLSLTGTGILINSPVNTGNNWSTGGPVSFTTVGASFVLSWQNASNAYYILACTVSGTTPAYGTVAGMPYTTLNGPNFYVSGSVLRAVGASSGSSVVFCRPYTISGTSITGGTVATATASGDLLRTYQNAGGNIVAQYINSTLFCAIFKLTGTAEGVSTVGISSNSPSLAQCDMLPISATKTLSISCTSNNVQMHIVTDTSGAASVGTLLSPSVASNFPSAVAALGVTSNIARVGLSGSTDVSALTMLQVDCSGSSPTLAAVLPTPRTTVSSAYVPVLSSNAYTARDPRHLRPGSSYFIGNGAFPFDIRLGSASVNRRVNPATVLDAGTGYANGALGSGNADSWFANALDNNGSGLVITHVEAAE